MCSSTTPGFALQDETMEFSNLSPQMPLPFIATDDLPEIGLLWPRDFDKTQEQADLQKTENKSCTTSALQDSSSVSSGPSCQAPDSPDHRPTRAKVRPRRYTSTSLRYLGKPASPGRKRSKKSSCTDKPGRPLRTVVIKRPPLPDKGLYSASACTSMPTFSEEKKDSFFHPNGSTTLDGHLGLRVMDKPPPDLPRMSPNCLVNQHLTEPSSDQLLSQVLENIDMSLFDRSSLSLDDYSNLEELSICKTALPDQVPFTVATSSMEGAQICKDVWSAQHAQHLCRAMMKPPDGPQNPSSTIIDMPSQDQLDMVRKKVDAGFAAAPRGCQGLPPQCATWIDAPSMPTPKRRTDFSLLTRNIGALRRSGYMHVCTSTQLTSINSLPGSLAVRYLVLMATLLGQPLLGQALPASHTDVPALLQGGSASPQPLLTWHQQAAFHQKTFNLGDTKVQFLFGYFSAIQITVPTNNRRLLRVDRIVDLAELSILQHNALHYTRLALDSEESITSDGFRLLAGAGTSVEYLLHKRRLSATSCATLAKSKHGRLPVSQVEVSFATEAVLWPEMIWTSPSQSSTKTGSSTFHYNLHLEDKQLLPLVDQPMPCTIWHMIRGKAVKIKEHQIGSNYIWFQNSGPGTYHVYNPWHLQASVSTNGSCAVYVPHDFKASTPDSFLQRCLVLRNGSLAAAHRRQLHSAVTLQQSRLQAIKGLPSEMRLQNQARTLGPLTTSTIRLIQPLQSGEEKLVLSTTEEALRPETRRQSLSPLDFRPLVSPAHVDPAPTPSALVALGSTLISTAGSFVIQSVTQEMLSKAMQRILAGGKYKYLDPLMIQDAIVAPDRLTYLQAFNSVPDQPYTWDEKENVLLLSNLKINGHIPDHAAQDEAQLASGLAIVTGAAHALEHFDEKGLQQLERVALNFLASSDLQIDTQQGGLVYVVRSGSVALISYFLSVKDTAPSRQTHRLHALPSYQGKVKGTSVALDLPQYFTLTHQAADVNSSAAQSSCAKALTSMEYDSALSEGHPACFTSTTIPPMLQTIYVQGTTRLIQTSSPPGQNIIAFLACAGQTAYRFKLQSEINLFLIPGSCQMDFTIMNSKLAAVERLTSEADDSRFSWLLAYNTSMYGYQLSAQEEAYVALYSILGAATLCGLILLGLAIKYKHLLPWFRPATQLPPQANTYRGLASSIVHPHLPRSLSDFSDSEESVHTEDVHVRPSSVRTRPPFSTYTATIRRGDKNKKAPADFIKEICNQPAATPQPAAQQESML